VFIATLRIATLALLLLAPAPVVAQDTYPTRSVRLIVAFGAGGTSDVLARLIGQKLSELWGQTVVIENRGGAGGNVAAVATAQAAPDGYTLLLTTQSLPINVTLMPNVPYDPERDFAAIVIVASARSVLVVGPQSTFKTLAELIAYAKAHPDELTYGSAGNGTVGHLGTELLRRLADIRMRHIPYGASTTQAYVDLMEGRVDVMMPALGGYVPQIQAGQFRALAVSGTTRTPAVPDVPTFAEAGVPDYAAPSWYGLFAPKDTPASIVARLNADVRRVLAFSDIRTRFSDMGFDAIGGPPHDLAALVRDELPKWAAILRDLRPAK
jgi:tripartite-type tricarboxylate transporter receptor subunit TctC